MTSSLTLSSTSYEVQDDYLDPSVIQKIDLGPNNAKKGNPRSHCKKTASILSIRGQKTKNNPTGSEATKVRSKCL